MIATLLAAYAARTYLRNRDWETEEALFRAAEKVNIASCMLAVLPVRKSPTSIRGMRKCFSVRKIYFFTCTGRSCIRARALEIGLRGQGCPGSLRSCVCRRCCKPGGAQVCPDSAKVRLNMGILERRYGRWPDSLRHFERAREIEPGCAPYPTLGANPTAWVLFCNVLLD